MTSPSILIPCAAYVLCGILAIVRLTGHKKRVAFLGACLLLLPRKKTHLVVLICLISVCLIGLLFFRSFALWITAVFALCGVMAIELALNDMLLRTCSGVYENGIVTDGKLVLRRDIVAFPTLAYEEKDDQKNLLPENMLKTVTKHTTIMLIFETANDRNATVELVKNWQN